MPTDAPHVVALALRHQTVRVVIDTSPSVARTYELAAFEPDDQVPFAVGIWAQSPQQARLYGCDGEPLGERYCRDFSVALAAALADTELGAPRPPRRGDIPHAVDVGSDYDWLHPRASVSIDASREDAWRALHAHPDAPRGAIGGAGITTINVPTSIGTLRHLLCGCCREIAYLHDSL